MNDMPGETPERETSGSDGADNDPLAALGLVVQRRLPCIIEGDVGVVSDAALTHYRHALSSAVVEVGELTIEARRALRDRQDVADVSGAQFHQIWMDTWAMVAVAFGSSVDDVLDTIAARVSTPEQSLTRHVVARMYSSSRDFGAVRQVIGAEPNPTMADLSARYAAPRIARDGLLEQAVELTDKYVLGDTTSMYNALLVEDCLARNEGGYLRFIQSIGEMPVRHAIEQSVLEYRIDRNCEQGFEPMREISAVEAATSATAIRRVLRWNGARVRDIERCDEMMRRYEFQEDKVSAAYEIGFGSGLTLNQLTRTTIMRISGPLEKLAMHHGYMLGMARTITRLQQPHG
jgi:hypothetical protein